MENLQLLQFNVSTRVDKMETLSVQEAESDLLTLIKQIQQDNQPLCVTSEEGNIILLSEESHQNLLVTLELLSTPGLMNSIKLYNSP
jgi:antitoxin YefM